MGFKRIGNSGQLRTSKYLDLFEFPLKEWTILALVWAVSITSDQAWGEAEG